MRTAAFTLLLLIAAVYALRRGGGPERAMAGIATAMVGFDFLLHRIAPVTYVDLDAGHLAIDLFGAGSTFLLAMVAYRFWPVVAAVLHSVPLLAHSSRVLDLAMHPAAYMIMQVASSWLVPPLLLLATWRHHRRLKQFGSYPSWRTFSNWRSLSRAKP